MTEFEPEPVFPNEILFRILFSLGPTVSLNNMALCSREMFREFKEHFRYCIGCKEWEIIYRKYIKDRDNNIIYTDENGNKIRTCLSCKFEFQCNIICNKCKFSSIIYDDLDCEFCHNLNCKNCLTFVYINNGTTKICERCIINSKALQCDICNLTHITIHNNSIMIYLPYKCENCDNYLCENCAFPNIKISEINDELSFCRDCLPCYQCRNNHLENFKIFTCIYDMASIVLCKSCIELTDYK